MSFPQSAFGLGKEKCLVLNMSKNFMDTLLALASTNVRHCIWHRKNRRKHYLYRLVGGRHDTLRQRLTVHKRGICRHHIFRSGISCIALFLLRLMRSSTPFLIASQSLAINSEICFSSESRCSLAVDSSACLNTGYSVLDLGPVDTVIQTNQPLYKQTNRCAYCRV